MRNLQFYVSGKRPMEQSLHTYFSLGCYYPYLPQRQRHFTKRHCKYSVDEQLNPAESHYVIISPYPKRTVGLAVDLIEIGKALVTTVYFRMALE